MLIVFAVPDCLMTYGTGSVRLIPGAPWFSDDPFVLEHPECFATMPPVVQSTTGRESEPVTLTARGIISVPRTPKKAPVDF